MTASLGELLKEVVQLKAAYSSQQHCFGERSQETYRGKISCHKGTDLRKFWFRNNKFGRTSDGIVPISFYTGTKVMIMGLFYLKEIEIPCLRISSLEILFNFYAGFMSILSVKFQNKPGRGFRKHGLAIVFCFVSCLSFRCSVICSVFFHNQSSFFCDYIFHVLHNHFKLINWYTDSDMLLYVGITIMYVRYVYFFDPRLFI